MSDPTDPGGVGAAQAERTSRTRVGDNGSPVGSPLTIILAVVAVVVGFLIFRTIDSGGGSALGTGGGTTAPVDPSNTTPGTVGGTTTPGQTAPGTTAPSTTTGADVIVINAGEVAQSARAVSDLLAAAGYTMVDPPVSDADDEAAATTIVYYTAGTTGNIAQTVAQSVANDLGVTGVEAAPATPFELDEADGTTGAATVFVLLGTDKSSITVLAPDAPTATAPAVVTPPTTASG